MKKLCGFMLAVACSMSLSACATLGIGGNSLTERCDIALRGVATVQGVANVFVQNGIEPELAIKLALDAQATGDIVASACAILAAQNPQAEAERLKANALARRTETKDG